MWLYVPAKIANLDQDEDSVKYGYLIGEKNDSAYIAMKGTSGVQSDTGWFIVNKSNPYPYFAASAISSGGEVLSEGSFRRWDASNTYCGEPAYVGGEVGGYLFKSFTQDAYIIAYNKEEPCYSLDTLSGTTSGDHFWNTGRKDIGMMWKYDWYTEEVVTTEFDAQLQGGVDSYKEGWGDDYIDHYHLKPKLDRWIHIKSSDVNDKEPAGKYKNPEDGSVIVVGTQTYECVEGPYKGTLWLGHALSKPSNGKAFYQIDGGTTKLVHRTSFRDSETEGWYIGSTSTSNTDPYYVYAPAGSAIDAKMFTAACWEYDKDRMEYRRATSADLQFQLGPYVVDTIDVNIKMGEVSLWR